VCTLPPRQEWVKENAHLRPLWATRLRDVCDGRGYVLELNNAYGANVRFWRFGERPKQVCTTDELWQAILLHHHGKAFTRYDLVMTGLAFLMYHEACMRKVQAGLNKTSKLVEAEVFAQVVRQMRISDDWVTHVLDGTLLTSKSLTYRNDNPDWEKNTKELLEAEEQAQGPSKWAKKKAKKKEKARQATTKHRAAEAQWATLAKKLRFAQAKVPAKRTTLELATAEAEEWARRKQRMRWVSLAVKLRHAQAAAQEEPTINRRSRHAQAASRAHAHINREAAHWEKRGKSVNARTAVAHIDKLLKDLLPPDEWYEAHNNREWPWNKMRKLVWKEYSEREEAAAAKAKAEAEAEQQRKLEHAERERERAEEAAAEAEKLWQEEQAKGGWELTNFPRAYNRKSRGARQREKRRQEKADASPPEGEEETKFALQMAQALQLSTEEAHAREVHRAQAERLEALAKANTKKAASPPPPPPPEEEEADDECLICWNGKATHVTVPCGHQAYCANCVPKDLGNCPMCREPMTHVIKFFKRGA